MGKELISIEAIAIQLGRDFREPGRSKPWPIFLVQKWLLANKVKIIGGKVTYRDALITVVGCSMEMKYADAEKWYDQKAQEIKRRKQNEE